jgi:hypothetical protein
MNGPAMRRALAALLCCACTLGWQGAPAAAELPVIKVRLDEPLLRLQADSTYEFPSVMLQGQPGYESVLSPHALVYEDESLVLRIDQAGGQSSLPTVIGYDLRLSPAAPPSSVAYVSVHALNDYADLRTALARVRELQALLAAQGFEAVPLPSETRYAARLAAAPADPAVLEDLERAFTDSAYYAKSAIAFHLRKGKLRVEAVLVNGRRKWGPRSGPVETRPAAEASQEEARTMTAGELLREPVYSLQLQIGATPEWLKERIRLRLLAPR